MGNGCLPLKQTAARMKRWSDCPRANLEPQDSIDSCPLSDLRPPWARNARYQFSHVGRNVASLGELRLSGLRPRWERRQAKYPANRSERAAVNWRRTEPFERNQVLTDGIAFVLCKAVTGMLRIQLLHYSITGSLGENRCRCDRQAPGIALHDA